MSGSIQVPPSPSLSRPVRMASTGSASGSAPSSSPQGIRSTRSALPPPPALYPSRRTSAPTNMTQSMTIEEMRQLHQKALSDAEAKRMELRLVLASRYRELVGSSDEVLRMRERSEELHQLVHALPQLLIKLRNSSKDPSLSMSSLHQESKVEDSSSPNYETLSVQLAQLPRVIHRALDNQDVYQAATCLIELFTLIASHTDAFPLANALGNAVYLKHDLTPMIRAQLKMTYLHVEPLPARTLRMSKLILLHASPSAERSASALTTLHLLKDSNALLDLYFDSKAKLLQGLLEKLDAVDHAEAILTQIVAILQQDIILHPYEIFILRSFPDTPVVQLDLVKTKASHFLAAHLPLIRTKVKSVLVSIAGTTASALGQIRQSLYDKTALDLGQDVIQAMVDVKIVLQQQSKKFSLWSALFSNTFSSLVHNLLTTSFHSVHSKVVSTLRTSLANAPPVMLPHEAYRNTLKIATDLNAALIKVSDDAHELLVHAEERVESEERLRQSLYVQTCEIMGRLVCELRRMATRDATYLVGRLCHLMTFRLTALQNLLHPDHSPPTVAGGMISLVELSSAFELADDNDDGLITIEEAMEAVDAAFSGTQFHGAEMVRETLLLGEDTTSGNVTLQELVLLCARGLKHKVAMETIQQSLHGIIESCFSEWSKAALSATTLTLETFEGTEAEWQRIYGDKRDVDLGEFKDFVEPGFPGPPLVGSVSPSIVGYFLSVASILNRSVCPADSNLVDTVRQALLKQSLVFLTESIKGVAIKEECASALIQLRVDFGFVYYCLLERNAYRFDEKDETVRQCQKFLKGVLSDLDKSISHVWFSPTLQASIGEKYQHVLQASHLYLTCLLGEDDALEIEVSTAAPVVLHPLPSSRRFALLPVQESDRSLAELQRRGSKYDKDESKTEIGAGSAVMGGLGFFSSMLKKK